MINTASDKTSWEEFCTTTVMPSQRLHHWNNFGSQTICDMTVDPADRDGFNANLRRIAVGQLGFITLSSTGAIARGAHGGAGIGNWAVQEQDAILILLPESGTTQFGETILDTEVSPGDLFIRDMSRPWIHACDSAFDMLMVKIPYSALAHRVDDPAKLLGVTLSGKRAPVAMTVDVMRSVGQMLASEPEGNWKETLADVVLDSVRVLYSSTSEATAWRVDRQERSSIRRNAKNYVFRHMDDGDLSVTQVASALGVSQRRLQRAFVDGGETLNRFIQEQRLDEAARLLARAGDPGSRSILDIALSVGFNDASHFSRSFSRRFGVAPRDFKKKQAI